MIKTLEGIKILDFTLAGAGPFTGRMLQACGAESTLVEPLAGTHTRRLPNYDYICSGKKSLTVNAKSEEGIEIIYRLVKESDVFLANYRARALEHLGLSYEKIKAINPRIIYATITGFGEQGEARNNPGYDATAFFARGSVLHTMSEEDVLPNAPSTLGDFTSAVGLCFAIAAALYRREQTGEGMRVYNSLFQTALAVNFDPISQGQRGTQFPRTRKAPFRALLNTYKCSDGKWIMITIPTLVKFFSLLDEVGRHDLVESGRWKMLADVMGSHSSEVVPYLDEIFAKMTRDEAMALMHKLDLACEPVQSVHEVIHDKQAWDNQYLQKFQTSMDNHEMIYPVLPPVKFGNDDADQLQKAPRLGEHSVEILKSLNYTDDEISKLIADGITSDGSKEDLYVRD